MSVTIDTAPPPARTLREMIADLPPGQSLRSDVHSLRVIRVTVSRVRAAYPDRRYKSAETPDGNRVWRIK